jgi:hypothetical protein
VQLVQLENTRPSPLTLVLPHELACSEESCICLRQQIVTYDHNAATGDASPRPRTRRSPSSLQLFGSGRPGSKSQPLPSSVQRAPDVVRQLRAGALRVVPVAAPVVPPPASAPEPQAVEATEAVEAVEAAEPVEPQAAVEPEPELAEPQPAPTDSPRRHRKDR